jgi:hypothetical protein
MTGDSFICLSEDLIKAYFNEQLTLTNDIRSECQSVQKGKLLVDSGHVQACSILNSTAHLYVSGIVRAAMKKKVAYNVRIKLESSGEIENADCECPAGKGPFGTCKHTAAMLLMLCSFAKSGDIAVEKACTESLQIFHHPKKPHIGSPIKVNNLHLGAKHKIKDDEYDPRPVKFRNWEGYNAHVSNMVSNYCYETKSDLAFRYLMPKADLQSAILDHDYLPAPFTQYWIESALKVSVQDIQAIEKATRKQRNSSRWFLERTWRVTASNFGEICKATDKRNVTKLCKTVSSTNHLHTTAVIHGQKYEQAAIKRFTEITGSTVEECGLFVSAEHPFLAATPDGVIGSQHVVEVKCPYKGKGKSIEPGNDFPFLTQNTDDGQLHLRRDHKYFYQIQGQLGVTKRRSCFFYCVQYKGAVLRRNSI